MTIYKHNPKQVTWQAYLALAYIEAVVAGPSEYPPHLMINLIRKRVAEFNKCAEALEAQAEAAR